LRETSAPVYGRRMPVILDDVDRRILALLREDARRTVTDIAAQVSLSPAPVRRRIDRLEEQGVITGYTVVVDPAALGPSVEAYVELRVVGNTDVQEIVDSARRIPEVEEVATTAGDPDALVRIRVENVDHLQRVINRLRLTGHVTGTKTLMVLGRWRRAH
jgi:Lrp/AsnC family leucine-responsive transcriptional regulator